MMKKKVALIALAASSLVGGMAHAVPVEYNGGLFDFNVTGYVGGTTYQITYTADFTSFSGGGQSNIGGIQFTVAGNDVTLADLMSAPGGTTTNWTDPAYLDSNLSAGGCGGGATGAVCSQWIGNWPSVTTTGVQTWVFNVTFTSSLGDISAFNANNTGNPIRMWFVDSTGRNRGLMSCVTGNSNGECGTAVPEPGTLALLGLGLLGIGASRRRRA